MTCTSYTRLYERMFVSSESYLLSLSSLRYDCTFIFSLYLSHCLPLSVRSATWIEHIFGVQILWNAIWLYFSSLSVSLFETKTILASQTNRETSCIEIWPSHSDFRIIFLWFLHPSSVNQCFNFIPKHSILICNTMNAKYKVIFCLLEFIQKENLNIFLLLIIKILI